MNENKELLNELCSRLPFGIKILYSDYIMKVIGVNVHNMTVDIIDDEHRFAAVPVDEIKLYLRPLSDMTDEEKAELQKKYNVNIHRGSISLRRHSEGYWDSDLEVDSWGYKWLFDWLNNHMFAYGQLLENDFVYLVTPENNPYR